MKKSSIHILGVEGLSNLGIFDNIYRGAQPDNYNNLVSILGVKSVINFRQFHDDSVDTIKAGMRHFAFPMSVLNPLSIEGIKKILDIMVDPLNQPVFVHCAQGHDRTGLVCAAYRILINGWSYAEAEEEMQSFIPSSFGEIWIPIRNRLGELK